MLFVRLIDMVLNPEETQKIPLTDSYSNIYDNELPRRFRRGSSLKLKAPCMKVTFFMPVSL